MSPTMWEALWAKVSAVSPRRFEAVSTVAAERAATVSKSSPRRSIMSPMVLTRASALR